MTMKPGGPKSARLLHLRAVAKHVGQTFASHPATSAILVFGSVAHGQVDKLSDVDLLIACRSAVPPLADRKEILNAIGSEWRFDRQHEGSLFRVVDEDGHVADVSVTVHYQTIAWIDAVLDAVLEYGAITTEQMPFRPYTVPALFQRAWVLLDRDGDVARWRAASTNYPSLLQVNILRHVVPDLREHVDELMRTADRGLGARNFIFFLNAAVDDLTSILFALNGVYDPADRRMHTTIVPFLPYLPTGYVATMTEVLEGPFDLNGALRRAQLFERLAMDVVRKASDVLGADAYA
ncbi:MAG: nucleotidyltransferase domain-containing protein [Thermomicrobiales bacterium]